MSSNSPQVISFENIELERLEHVTFVKLNRPAALNALNTCLMRDI